MRLHLLASLMATIAILAMLTHYALSDIAPLRIEARPRIAFAPTDVSITIRLRPDKNDRTLRVETDGGSSARASAWSLDGEHSPRLYQVYWQQLDAGAYRIIAAVGNQQDGWRATATVDILVIEP